MAGVSVNDVTKKYGAVKVLHGVNVEIEDDEFAVLAGLSGCR